MVSHRRLAIFVIGSASDAVSDSSLKSLTVVL
jgi:hypothetical protein